MFWFEHSADNLFKSDRSVTPWLQESPRENARVELTATTAQRVVRLATMDCVIWWLCCNLIPNSDCLDYLTSSVRIHCSTMKSLHECSGADCTSSTAIEYQKLSYFLFQQCPSALECNGGFPLERKGLILARSNLIVWNRRSKNCFWYLQRRDANVDRTRSQHWSPLTPRLMLMATQLDAIHHRPNT